MWRCFVAHTADRAVLAFKMPGASPHRIFLHCVDDWKPSYLVPYRAWDGQLAYDQYPLEGATISDVSESAAAIAERWRDRNPVEWWELHIAPLLWLVTGKDGSVALRDAEPDKDAQAVPLQAPNEVDAYALLRFPHL